jgi:hypothetical protein
MLRAVTRPEEPPGTPSAPAWLSDGSLAAPADDNPPPPDNDTMPVQPAVWVPPAVQRPRGPSKGFFIAYFAAGLALLLTGTLAVVYLAVRAYGNDNDSTPTAAASQPVRVPTPGRTATRTTPPPSTGPNGVELGPQRLAMGKALAVTGEGGERFQVTVKAGKFRKSGCDPYAVKPKKGGYLPTEVKVKVTEGVPDISDFDFRFQTPDGTWLDSVGGSGCEENYGGLFRKLSAGRTYSTTVIFDVPAAMKGDIVFVWPLQDVIGTWKVG